MKKLMIVLAIVAVFAFAAVAQAEIEEVRVDVTGVWTGETYTLVTADRFSSGATEGNTATSGGTYFTGATWPSNPPNGYYRSDGNMSSPGFHPAFVGISLPGTYGHTSYSAGAMELVTSVTGLSAGQYDVYAVWVHNNSNVAQWNAGLTSAMTVSLETNGTTSTSADDIIGGGDPTVFGWTTYLQKVGTTAAGATEIEFHIQAVDTIRTSLYVGVAYQEVPIPEPAGLGLMGLALLALRRRRS